MLQELDTVLHRLQLQGRSHGDLRPDRVQVISRQPLHLVTEAITEAGNPATFGDLSAHIATHVGLYTAPERLIGIEAPRSDWWSLGLLVLQALVGPSFWEGVHEKAWQLQVITDGVVLPDSIPEPWSTLLAGLLTLDPQERWGHEQVVRWLSGDDDIPIERGERTSVQEGSVIRLSGARHRSPARYALAAAQAEAWDEALSQLQQGELLTWLEENGVPPATLAEVRRLGADETLEPDERLMLVLVLLNPNLPLCLRGEVIGAGTLTANPLRARGWLEGVLPIRLRRIERHLWLTELAERRTSILELARTLQLSIEESRFEAAALITDRRRLEQAWAERRKDWPAALHNGLANLISRSRPSAEHLILLLSAELTQFRSAADVLQAAQRLAGPAGVEAHWDEASARQWLARSQRDVMIALQERLADFVRCGLPEVDAWADAFRSDQRVPAEQALLLLAIPAERWERPEGGEHWQRLLQFFRRRVLAGIQRGPLLALSVRPGGKRIDLAELASNALPAEAIINHLVARQTRARSLDPAHLEANPALNQRMRRLRQEAEAYQRETGIMALYLGYPLLVRRGITGSSGAAGSPKLLPLLLWPVRVGVTAHGTLPQLAYDKERANSDGIRLNPALENVLPLRQFLALKEALEEVQQRSTLTGSEVMDVMRTIFPTKAGVLQRCPQNPTLPSDSNEQLLPSGVLFLCNFSAQTLAHELEQLERRPSVDGPMAALLRLASTVTHQPPALTQLPEEHERFLVTPADPSQKRAVWASRNTPGVLIQGPPGTGKSQTIVNIVADALGRRERVLVVCQKQAALEVVKNRLEAAGVGGRLCLITDPSSDRRNLLLKLREDLDHWDANFRREGLTRERLAIAGEISRLERELDALHLALAKPNTRNGLEYRQVIDELLRLGEPDGVPSITFLRPLLHDRHIEEVRTVARQCADISGLWLRAHPENSPLQVLEEFSTDEGTIKAFAKAFTNLQEADNLRTGHLAELVSVIESRTPDLVVKWMNVHAPILQSLDDKLLATVLQWFPLFTDQSGDNIRLKVAKLDEELRSLSIPGSTVKWQSHLDILSDSEIDNLVALVDRINISCALLSSRLKPEYASLASVSDLEDDMTRILKAEESRREKLHYLERIEKWSRENAPSLSSLAPKRISLISTQESLSLGYWNNLLTQLATIKSDLKQSQPQHDTDKWDCDWRNLGDHEISELVEATRTRRQLMYSLSRFLNPAYSRCKATLKQRIPDALVKKDKERLLSLEQSLQHEADMRVHRDRFHVISRDIGIEQCAGNASCDQLLHMVEDLEDDIKHILKYLGLVASCPSRSEVETALLAGSSDALNAVCDSIAINSKRDEVRAIGINVMDEISRFFLNDWRLRLESKISATQSVTADISEVHVACSDFSAACNEILQSLPMFSGETEPGQLLALGKALAHDARMRSLRLRLYGILRDLGVDPGGPMSTRHDEFLTNISSLQRQLNDSSCIVASVLHCPLQQDAERALKTGSIECLSTFLQQLDGGVKRHKLRRQCHICLDALAHWFSKEWIEKLG